MSSRTRRVFITFIPILISWTGAGAASAAPKTVTKTVEDNRVEDNRKDSRKEEANLSEPPIRAHTMIRVKMYDAKSATYEVTIVEEPYVGPNIAVIDDLCHAVHSLNLGKLTSDPRSIIGQEFSTDSSLLLLSEDGVKARATRFHSKPR